MPTLGFQPEVADRIQLESDPIPDPVRCAGSDPKNPIRSATSGSNAAITCAGDSNLARRRSWSTHGSLRP
ncbi:hypothetical protein L596_011667 [Steinernema carpocapsae]|uniref:Uncharacterized protein n=1 Tax=Steinernema carpocapsae TaxID=34508 RepID=A0A4U5NVI8_STECR|nr:hypothetical protein L596_011667 [Steinernema carpocapsae]